MSTSNAIEIRLLSVETPLISELPVLEEEAGHGIVHGGVDSSQGHGLPKEAHRERRPGHDVVGQVECLQVGKDQGDEGCEEARPPVDSDAAHPVFPGCHLEVADEVGGDRHEDRENARGGEGGNQQGQRGQQDPLHEKDRHCRDEIPSEGGFFDFGDRRRQFLGRLGERAMGLHQRILLA